MGTLKLRYTDVDLVPQIIPLQTKVGPWKVVKVGKQRHTVHWDGEQEPSSVTYCNACGSSLVLEDVLEDGRHIDYCGGCNAYMGLSDEQPEDLR